MSNVTFPTTSHSIRVFHAGGTVTSTSEGTSKSNMVSSDLTWQLLFSHYDSKRNHFYQLQEGCSRPVAQNPSKWFDCKVNLDLQWFLPFKSIQPIIFIRKPRHMIRNLTLPNPFLSGATQFEFRLFGATFRFQLRHIIFDFQAKLAALSFFKHDKMTSNLV